MIAGELPPDESLVLPRLEPSVDAAASALDAAMERFARGDDSAVLELHLELAPRLQAFFQRLSGRADLARRLTGCAFSRLCASRGAFGTGCPALPWAYAIARHCYADWQRAMPARPCPDPDAGSTQRALATMDLACREAFVLIRYEGFSIAETARLLGISETLAKRRALQAHQLLRNVATA